jgi:hypothetical protein
MRQRVDFVVRLAVVTMFEDCRRTALLELAAMLRRSYYYSDLN